MPQPLATACISRLCSQSHKKLPNRVFFKGDDISCSTTEWRIPRPLLYSSSSGTNSSIGTSNYERNIRCIYTAELASEQKLDSIQIDMPSGENWFSSGSSTSSNSTSSSRVSLTIISEKGTIIVKKIPYCQNLP